MVDKDAKKVEKISNKFQTYNSLECIHVMCLIALRCLSWSYSYPDTAA